MTLSISFEVFPPKSVDGLDGLRSTVSQLSEVGPTFVSVTYGAGGSDRERSFAAIDAVRAEGFDVAGHLTCVGQARSDIDVVIERYAELGVSQIVALRGDPPAGVDASYQPHADGYQRTADLVKTIKQRGDFGVAVSAYPERHPQSPTDGHDLNVLAEKVDAGADKAMTQMFFDNCQFLRYRDRARAYGIDIPIVPGIFPIHSFPTVARFAERCGASIPSRIADRFAGLDDDIDTTQVIAAEIAASQIRELADHGVDAVHIYTLNRADLALAVCQQLGVSTKIIAA
ncbi:MAG TPA: methylenetetrahydrofolate reductase [NAD(P)H] [Ilumatobacteraceae bacterium]|nr:methylenetetrahydrofolate reductase [NAD(P)H] [Ilumatobacteraceae bacterium]